MSKVVLIACDSYDKEKVYAAVQKGLNLLGGSGQFAKAGEKILFKVNLLVGDNPDKCVTTHPEVLKAVAKAFKETGAKLGYGDGPAMGSTASASQKSGLTKPAQETGVELKEFQPGQEVVFKEGKQNKKFFLAKAVLDSDGVISLPKMKTHGLEKITGAVKNQFGCIPSIRKAEFHVRLPNSVDFAKMLVDLTQCVRPRLYIMDGIMAMEGNGPRSGTPRKMGVLLFSTDPIALDATFCRMIALDPLLVPTIRFGQEFGAGTYEEGKIELLGDPLSRFITPDFNVDRKPLKPFKPSGMLRFLSNRLVPRPVIDPAKCIKCGICVQVCPVPAKAVNWGPEGKSQPPVHNYKICIRCYCCQELCPEKAIDLQKPLLRRLFS